jgi:hypothetical protein
LGSGHTKTNKLINIKMSEIKVEKQDHGFSPSFLGQT